MSSSDAIVIGEDWISEHYFNAESGKQSFLGKVLERRKEWDEADVVDSVRSRFIAARRDLESALAELMSGENADNGGADAAVSDLYGTLRRVLGYTSPEYAFTVVGPAIAVSAPGITEAAPLVIIQARPIDSVDVLLAKDADTLLIGYPVDDKTTLTSTARLLSTLFVDSAGPDFALVLAGRWALVAEKERWAEGRYLAVDLQLVCERNDTKRGGEIERTLACLAAESLAPDADGKIWWTDVLAESIMHTVGVSGDLREGVRLSIEIIANEVVDRRRARQLEPLPQAQAQPLAKQALRFLYRILFLLYAEASPELGVLPVGAGEYEQGYGLDRLRDLTLTELASNKARTGTHLFDSLATLFRLVDQGHAAKGPKTDGAEGLTFSGLKADLFHPTATTLIDEVGLGNVAVRNVLGKLLLSKESKGRERGFISYAELGINQLGAVYEGLMSYTGFFAETDLYEVAKNGDATKGSWVVPVVRAEGIAETDFVREDDEMTGEPRAVIHRRGTFVFRLAGRERQQSASYYTPEVLTRFTVSQALEELLDQDGHTTTADEILGLTVCEPALGSGAFAIEAVRQLASQYLRRRQLELAKDIDPDAYQLELQRVKASIALHQVHGVDLNATAVELAEISLWLDTMVEGLEAPWFGLHLKRGNSLIGARHAVYARHQVNDRSWLKTPPTDLPLEVGPGQATTIDGVHHFLLPAAGWGSATESKEAAGLAPEAVKALKSWHSQIQGKPSKKQIDALSELSSRVEVLWGITLRRLDVAEIEARRHIPLWGREEADRTPAVLREQIEATLNHADGAYQRLRRVMDAWCALWFWPLTDTGGVTPPNLDDWITALQGLLGRDLDFRNRNQAQQALGAATDWAEIDAAEELDLSFAQAKPVDLIIVDHPWLAVCAQVATQQGFLHWELDFAPVLSRGGFDLQIGNPPWVEVKFNGREARAEFDPWWVLSSSLDDQEAREELFRANAGAVTRFLDDCTQTEACGAFLSSAARSDLSPLAGRELYRSFLLEVWRNQADNACVGLIHPYAFLTHKASAPLRGDTYARLRRMWAFTNELKLFEIQNQKPYSVSIYGARKESPSFQMASNLLHPRTVENSLRHSGAGAPPGVKTAEGEWDTSAHRSRIQTVDRDFLNIWLRLNGEGGDWRQASAVFTVSSEMTAMRQKISEAHTLIELGAKFQRGRPEEPLLQGGQLVRRWGPVDSWANAHIQGSFFKMLHPFAASPRRSMAHATDWEPIPAPHLDPAAMPVTIFKPTPKFARDQNQGEYKLAYRKMIDVAGQRSMYTCLVPSDAIPGDSVMMMTGLSDVNLLLAVGSLGSIVDDYTIRTKQLKTTRPDIISACPLFTIKELRPEFILRVLRLNCVTRAYSSLWESAFSLTDPQDDWTVDGIDESLTEVSPTWEWGAPLRSDESRRQALLELDVLMALSIGLSPEELWALQVNGFGTLLKHSGTVTFAVNGQQVSSGSPDASHVRNRRDDSIAAYREFERRLAERMPRE
jgi:hypothetical protein